MQQLLVCECIVIIDHNRLKIDLYYVTVIEKKRLYCPQNDKYKLIKLLALKKSRNASL